MIALSVSNLMINHMMYTRLVDTSATVQTDEAALICPCVLRFTRGLLCILCRENEASITEAIFNHA